MRVEIRFKDDTRAVIVNGKWTADHKAILPGVMAVSDRIEDSPSIPNLDFAKASAVAEAFSGEVITLPPKSAAVAGRVY